MGRRVEAQAGDRGDAAAARGVEEQQSREAAVGDEHEIAARQPTPRLKDHLPPDVEWRPVSAALLAAGALRGDESRQEWQRPDPPGPGNGRQRAMRLIQRSPLVLTKRASDERTGSR